MIPTVPADLTVTAPWQVCAADYTHGAHALAIVDLLDAYARDPAGGGQGLSQHARTHLVAALARRPQWFSVLAFDGPQAVGLINCMEGFSTFACQPLVNVHDVVVLADYRGRGVGRSMFSRVESLARQRGACKLTLEVLQGNRPAFALYTRLGFAPYALDPELGNAVFLQKWLG